MAAANLVRNGIPVTVFEAGPALSEESRASTFHPPTLDMLHTLGAAEPLIAQGLVAPKFQYRTKQQGLLAEFDFGVLGDLTGHPYRVQCEQSKLTRILHERLQAHPDFAIEFNAEVQGVDAGRAWRRGRDCAQRTDRDAPRRLADRRGRRAQRRAPLARYRIRRLHLAGALSGGRARRSISAPSFPDLALVSYVADPRRWHFLLQIPGLCRVMFPIAAEESDELALSRDFAQSLDGGYRAGRLGL